MDSVIEIFKDYGIIGWLVAAAFAFYKFVIEKRVMTAGAKKTEAETATISIGNKAIEQKDLSTLNQDLLNQFGQHLKHTEIIEQRFQQAEQREADCEKRCSDLEAQVKQIQRELEQSNREHEREKKTWEEQKENLFQQVKDLLDSDDAKRKELDRLRQRIDNLGRSI